MLNEDGLSHECLYGSDDLDDCFRCVGCSDEEKPTLYNSCGVDVISGSVFFIGENTESRGLTVFGGLMEYLAYEARTNRQAYEESLPLNVERDLRNFLSLYRETLR